MNGGWPSQAGRSKHIIKAGIVWLFRNKAIDDALGYHNSEALPAVQVCCCLECLRYATGLCCFG